MPANAHFFRKYSYVDFDHSTAKPPYCPGHSLHESGPAKLLLSALFMSFSFLSSMPGIPPICTSTLLLPRVSSPVAALNFTNGLRCRAFDKLKSRVSFWCGWVGMRHYPVWYRIRSSFTTLQQPHAQLCERASPTKTPFLRKE